ncbi:DUF4031 domain-containing protein [Phycicoccus sp. BSK3Z-2]|uniref:DUF4031 domain-containing protein n=1 Tax=Phycicoccus avicenniae TaxID=2828860 RepID=A0A941HZA2_9MICO|nr:DUF4031 domain-containing protein [Phycicoccus avicenniae]MBR7741979.1 DUF4031 domain-containing protein [Phycicoccus avicenniae]
MALLIDPPRFEAHGRRWSHLVSDTSIEELHAFARRAGLPAWGYEGDHYDVPEERYAAVVAAGARPVEGREVVRALRSSGLRMRKRKGDRGVARVRADLPDGTSALVDLLRGGREVDERRVFCAVVLVVDAGGDHLVVHSVRRRQWGPPGGERDPGETVREAAVRELHEETGLVADPTALVPVGYERFADLGDGGTWPPGRDLLQLYRLDLPERRPATARLLDDVDDVRWVTWDELVTLCGDDFYWPVLEAVLRPRGG